GVSNAFPYVRSAHGGTVRRRSATGRNARHGTQGVGGGTAGSGELAWAAHRPPARTKRAPRDASADQLDRRLVSRSSPQRTGLRPPRWIEASPGGPAT